MTIVQGQFLRFDFYDACKPNQRLSAYEYLFKRDIFTTKNRRNRKDVARETNAHNIESISLNDEVSEIAHETKSYISLNLQRFVIAWTVQKQTRIPKIGAIEVGCRIEESM